MRTLNELLDKFKTNVSRDAPKYVISDDVRYAFMIGAAYVMNEIQESNFYTNELDEALINMLPKEFK